jgi:hypothetical protein
MSLVTFIIPTVGRSTIDRTLLSLKSQTDADWDAIILADMVNDFSPGIKDTRFHLMSLTRKVGFSNCSGNVRNFGFSFAPGEWCGFVDDDDRLDEHYVEWLRQEGDGHDLVVFRMMMPDGSVLPSGSAILPCQVGISFSIRRQFQLSANVWFGPSPTEDWDFIHGAIHSGARHRVSDRIAYYVRH